MDDGYILRLDISIRTNTTRKEQKLIINSEFPIVLHETKAIEANERNDDVFARQRKSNSRK